MSILDFECKILNALCVFLWFTPWVELSHIKAKPDLVCKRSGYLGYHCWIKKGAVVTEIPKDIPQGIDRLEIKGTGVTRIRYGILNNLKKCRIINFDFNEIRIIERNAFYRVNNLRTLNLYGNLISHIQNETFAGLGLLEDLNIGQNKLNELCAYMFKDLRNLKKLTLNFNNISHIDRETFKHNSNLWFLSLNHNKFHQIIKDWIHFLCALHVTIQLSDNAIRYIQPGNFCEECDIETINLRGNELKILGKDSFGGLSSALKLIVSFNMITDIEPRAFSSLTRLERVILSSNYLTIIRNWTFVNLHSVKHIDLKRNKIRIIESSAFDLEHLNKVDLNYNELMSLTWEVFVNKQSGDIAVYADKANTLTSVLVVGNDLLCSNETCWIRTAQQEEWVKSSLKESCWSSCPSEHQFCFRDNLELSQKNCTFECAGLHKGGELYIDYNVCPFQYFCNCYECPVFRLEKCEKQCNDTGLIPVAGAAHVNGCKICECQCHNGSCAEKCKGHPYIMTYNAHGCKECECHCPEIDCDAPCGGEGLGLHGPKDEVGCSATCAGCRAIQGKKQSTKLIIPSVILPVCVLFITASCCFGFFISSAKFKKAERKSAELDLLVKNLSSDLAWQVKDSWIDPNSITKGHLLGHGQFGIVWSGKIRLGPSRETEVAMKTIKCKFKEAFTGKIRKINNDDNNVEFNVKKVLVEAELDVQVIVDFLQEVTIMKKFDHPNVLSLIGVSVHENKPCALLPLMSNGDLKKFLNKHGSNITVPDLLAFCLGVAKGMEHLEERKFVHRDLAARNCMLDSKLVVKVSDFGLTKNTEQKNYYRTDDESKELPIRWMSVEAMEQSMFTTQSDVWSYGVVMWEIFTLGGQPYQDKENKDIREHLRQGKRLNKPELAESAVYQMMLDCWHDEPEERPSFTELISRLNAFADTTADYLRMETADENSCERECKDLV